MWLTVDENGKYKVHYWENGQLVDQDFDKDNVPMVEEYMEVREE